MIALLRLVGTVNAALWFGGTLFFTLILGPAFFSDMLTLFGWPKTGMLARYYAGAVAQMMIERYFIIQYCCGAIALAHLAVERLYTGRVLRRSTLYLVVGLFGLGLAGGLWLQPRMRQLHQTMYGLSGPVTPAQAEQARRAFGIWHGISQSANLVSLAGLVIYLWQVTRPGGAQRPGGRTKFGLE
ncbi:MAG: DUF4149 domain-containing protein [Candidatus Omnitrophica bacterium]|nr:DUF4149 domain-containing protein [Candidatus Omnitrophota bacterium]